jgi:hypothetical protein
MGGTRCGYGFQWNRGGTAGSRCPFKATPIRYVRLLTAPKPRYNRKIPVDLKRIISTFTYRIEAKPEGGFIGHSSDPNVAPLEAATREELQQKIQTTIAAAVAEQFPGLKLRAEGQTAKFDFHIEAKPGGGFSIHSHSDPIAAPVEGATHADIELPFAEKIAGVLGKYFLPELSQALAQKGSGDIHVEVNKKISLTTTPAKAPFGIAQDAASLQPKNASSGTFSLDLDASSNTPITRETSHTGTIVRFLLTLLAVVAVMYFFLHRR